MSNHDIRYWRWCLIWFEFVIIQICVYSTAEYRVLLLKLFICNAENGLVTIYLPCCRREYIIENKRVPKLTAKVEVSLPTSDAVWEAEGEKNRGIFHTKGKCMTLLSLIDSWSFVELQAWTLTHLKPNPLHLHSAHTWRSEHVFYKREKKKKKWK